MTKKLLNLIALALLCCTANSAFSTDIQASAPSECAAFVNSFLTSYEFNTSGRYAHEYHPFILNKTSASMLQLEQAFVAAGMQTPGRFVLMGYEETAFPNFLPRIQDSLGQSIDDEASFKDPRGWSIQLHNRFGTMTGFLFRNINNVAGNKQFVHVHPERVELFYPGMLHLQKYLFGTLADTIFNIEHEVVGAVKKNAWDKILQQLIVFWQGLYRGGYTSGDQQVVGTQDILFSIENAKFLQRSKVPLLKFFAGPDITYPIVVSQTCGAKATENAQAFLTHFVPQLKALNDEKTLYVFRSFVDGVGKSTLLGNINNWMQHGVNYQDYAIVDNTSTLDYEFFAFNEKVFIADLPAQISHFTYKPDGSVWVDLKAVTNDQATLLSLQQHFVSNFGRIQSDYQAAVAQTQKILQESGPGCAELHDASRPELTYIRNLILLQGLAKNHWLPFVCQGQHYLGNRSNPYDIKVLHKIGQARSEGLKNADAAQMIFDQGLCFPAVYQEFVDKLVGQAKEQGIKNVVFVDFLSMYSRSSRENIRLNFLLQMMAQVASGFNPFNSTYRNFVSNSEMLAMLLHGQSAQECRQALELETLVRYGLYQMMQDVVLPNLGCRTISEQDTFAFLDKFRNQIAESDLQLIEKTTEKKLLREIKSFKEKYALTKEFCNLYSIDFDNICKFSDFFQHFFSTSFKHKSLNEMWSGLDAPITSSLPEDCEGWLDEQTKVVQLANGTRANLLCVLSPENRDVTTVSRFLATIRSAWYLSALNILCATNITYNSEWHMQGDEHVQQVPVVVKKHANGSICLLTKALPIKTNIVDGAPVQVYSFADKEYAVQFALNSTAQGMFSFGSTDYNKVSGQHFGESEENDPLWWYAPGYGLMYLLNNKALDSASTANKVVPSGKAFEIAWAEMLVYYRRSASYILKQNQKQEAAGQKKETKKSGSKESLENIINRVKININAAVKQLDSRAEEEVYPGQREDDQEQKSSTDQKFLRQFMPEELVPAASLFVRVIATLEAVARDIDSSILTTQKPEDFYASLKLLEHCMLPQNLGILFEKDLFDLRNNQEKTPVIDLTRPGKQVAAGTTSGADGNI